MQSSLLLLLLSCPWPVNCGRRTPPPSLEKDQPLHSFEKDLPLYLVNREKSSHSFKDLQTISRRSQAKKLRNPKSTENRGCLPTDGTSYNGTANTTESGLTCQMWSVNTPHEHNYNDVGDHNYCRDTFGERKSWCYTTDPEKAWEYCDVPLCATKGI